MRELEEELGMLRLLIKVIDEALTSKSFKTAMDLLKEERPLAEYTLTSTTNRTPLARMLVFKEHLKIVPLKELHASTPPFKSFLIERVLEGMKREDERKVERGIITPEEAFDYEIVEGEGGIIKEIIIRNYSNRRLNEIRGACRWTFEKMYEKERTSS